MSPPPPPNVSVQEILNLLDKHAAGEEVSLEIGHCTIWAGQPDIFERLTAYALQSDNNTSRQLAWQAVSAWGADANTIKWLVSNLDHSDADIRARATDRLLSRFEGPFGPLNPDRRELEGQPFLPYLEQLMKLQNSDDQTRYKLAMTLAAFKGIDEQIWPLTLSFLDDPMESLQIVTISGITTMPELALREPELLVNCFERIVGHAEVVSARFKVDWARNQWLLNQVDRIVLRMANLLTKLPKLTNDVGALATKAAALFGSPVTKSALAEVAALAADQPTLPDGLLEMVNSNNPNSRVTGIRALGFLGAKSKALAAAASSHILVKLAKEESPLVRAAGMLAWRDMGPAAGEGAVNYLCSTLSARHAYNYRECAAAALAFVSSADCKKTIDVLNAALIDSNPRVRSTAGFALSKLTGLEKPWEDEFVNKYLCKQETEPTAEPFTHSSTMPPHLTSNSFSLTFPANESSIEAYLDRLVDQDPIVRSDALASLARTVIMSSGMFRKEPARLFDPEQHTDKLALLENWLNDPDHVVRHNAMCALPLFGNKAHHLADRVLHELSRSESGGQSNLPNVIVAIGEAKAIERLVPLIGTTAARTADILEALGPRLGDYLEGLLTNRRTQLEVLSCLWYRHDSLTLVTPDLLLKVLEIDSDEICMNYLTGPCTTTERINARSIAIKMAMRNYPGDDRLLAQIRNLAECADPLVRKAALESLSSTAR